MAVTVDNMRHTKKATTSLVQIEWAALQIEPICSSGEFITAAVIAIAPDQDMVLAPTFTVERARAVFGDLNVGIRDMLAICRQSLATHTANGHRLDNWKPPLSGVRLGSSRLGMSIDAHQLVARAMPSISFLFDGAEPGREHKAPKEPRWSAAVEHCIVEHNPMLKRQLAVRVLLANHDVPATFTFFNPTYAAVAVPPQSFKQYVKDAKANLWNLDQLAEAHFMFKPKRRELICGLPEPTEQAEKTTLQFEELIEELREEAQRRDVLVTSARSPREAAIQIVREAA